MGGPAWLHDRLRQESRTFFFVTFVTLLKFAAINLDEQKFNQEIDLISFYNSTWRSHRGYFRFMSRPIDSHQLSSLRLETHEKAYGPEAREETSKKQGDSDGRNRRKFVGIDRFRRISDEPVRRYRFVGKKKFVGISLELPTTFRRIPRNVILTNFRRYYDADTRDRRNTPRNTPRNPLRRNTRILVRR
ncbi:hypothetical protein YC2023_061314 [Brassica napus]